jgi:aminopeptidase
MPSREHVRKYAEVAINVGLGLEPGDRILIAIPRELPEFAHDLVDVAYEGGAEDVEVQWFDAHVDRSRFTHGGDAAARTVSQRSRFLASAFEDGVSYLRVSAEDPAALAGVDPERVGGFMKANGEVVMRARAGQMALEDPWAVIGAPVPGWTTSVFPEEDLAEATERMWSAILRACRIDQPDPVGAWRTHLDDLGDRARHLTSRQYAALRYRGPGTDLEVGLTGRPVWEGGATATPAGRPFCPNIPTEEVFTSPHRSKATGRVTATKPLSYFGALIEDFWFEMEDGAVVDSGAGREGAVLDRILGTDDGSARFGEVAMVPQSGAVAAEGLVWRNTLYDENDACHIALGASYPMCFEGGTGMSGKDRLAVGLNQSVVHADFVVGSPDVSVHGVTADGSEEPIILDGEWGFTA